MTLLLGIAGCALLFAFTALIPLRTEEGGCGACGGGGPDGSGGCGLRGGSDAACPLLGDGGDGGDLRDGRHLREGWTARAAGRNHGARRIASHITTTTTLTTNGGTEEER